MDASDPRFLALARELHRLNGQIPAQPSPMPENLTAQLQDSNSDYIRQREFVKESLEQDTEMYDFRVEKEQYESSLVKVLSCLHGICNHKVVNDYKNAYKHLWDQRNNPDFTHKIVTGLQLVRDTANWNYQDWLRFIFTRLEQGSDLPPEISGLDDLAVHAAQIGVRNNAIRSAREAVVQGLQQMDWDDYVRVREKDNNQYADQALFQKLGYANVVEINGFGGLGKTELLYQFLRRHIKGEYDPDIPAFDHYVILTAKSEEQGEVDTINSSGGSDGLVTTNPSDVKHGPRDYVQQLKFKDVIRIINTYDTLCEDLDSMENARRVFKEGNILIALDNFEDCSTGDIQQFQDFFNHGDIKRALQSRIIITGRSHTFSVDTIRLQPLPPEQAQELFRKRYQHLYNLASTNSDFDWVGSNRVLTGLRDSNFSKKFEHMCNDNELNHFRHMFGHPLFIFHFTTLLGNTSLIEKHHRTEDGAFDLIRVLRSIIKDNTLELNAFHENLYQWIIDKAYRKIEKNQVAILILKTLMLNGRTSESDLRKIINENGYRPREDFDAAVEELESHDLFLRKQTYESKTIWLLEVDGEKFLNSQDGIRLRDDHESNKPSTMVEETIQSLLSKIHNSVNIGEIPNLEPLLTQLSKSPLVDRVKITLGTYRLILSISSEIDASQQNWSQVHNQAIEGLKNQILNERLHGGSIPQAVGTLLSLYWRSSFASDQEIWNLITDQKMIRKVKSEMMKNGSADLAHHRLCRLLEGEPRQLEDWYRWCAWHQHLVGTRHLNDHVWEKLRKNLLNSQSDLEDLIQQERTKDQYQLDMASQFIQNQTVVVDLEWSRESFELLKAFDCYPTESDTTNIAKWKRYTRPPRIPEEFELLPNTWEPPNGLSFDHLGPNNRAVFVDVDDAYSTYRDDALGILMADDSGKDDTGKINFDEKAMAAVLVETLKSIELAFRQAEIRGEEKLHLVFLPAALTSRLKLTTGINDHLSTISGGEFTSLKMYIQTRLIFDQEFSLVYSYNQDGPLGYVTKRTRAVTRARPPSDRAEQKEAALLKRVFEETAPQFPTVEDTVTIIEHFVEWVEDQPMNNDGVAFGNKFKKHGRNRILKKPGHFTVAFGLGFQLSSTPVIGPAQIIHALKRHGVHRIKKDREQKAHHNTLEKILDGYLDVLEGRIAGLNTVVRNPSLRLFLEAHEVHSTTNISPYLNGSSMGVPGGVNDTEKNTHHSRDIGPPVVRTWFKIIAERFPDRDLDKHVKSAMKLHGLKPVSAEKFVVEIVGLNVEALQLLEDFLEQRVNNDPPTPEQLRDALFS